MIDSRGFRGYRAACMAMLASMLGLVGSAHAQVNDKWITVVLPQEPPNLDACNSSRTYGGRVLKYTIAEPLIQKNAADGSLSPRLATKWEQVEPTLWRITLRQGVTFHDGKPFNAEAVKKSLERQWIPALVCGDKAKFFGDLGVELTAVDAYTLDIKTSRPEAILPMRLTGVVIEENSPTDKVMPAGMVPIGTGPYVFDSWQGGQQILFKRNEKYWGQKGEIEGVRYIWRAESAVRAAMVDLGEADIAYTIGQQDATNPKTDSSYLNSETIFARIDVAIPPFNDVRVRRAVKYALDLDAMPGSLLPSTALLATQLVMPSIPGHNADLDKRALRRDPAKAKQLLAEAKAAGVPVDTEIQLVSRPDQYPGAEEVAEAIASMLRDVGFKVKSMPLEAGLYGKYEYKPFAEGRLPVLLLSSHDNNFGDPVFTVFFRYACGGTPSAYCDPALDAQILKVSGMAGEERVKGWQEVFRTLYDDAVADVPLFHMVSFTRINPRLNFKPDVSMSNEIRIAEIKFVPGGGKK